MREKPERVGESPEVVCPLMDSCTPLPVEERGAEMLVGETLTFQRNILTLQNSPQYDMNYFPELPIALIWSTSSLRKSF